MSVLGQRPDRTVITYGTFDLFHYGHVRLLERLSRLGSRLIVACSTDEFNAKKGKASVVPFESRAKVLGACRYVDRVIPETNWAQKRDDIRRYDVDLFAMGDDWAGKFDDLRDLCDILYLPRTEGVSTTEIKRLIGASCVQRRVAAAGR
ncbi:glycerol-3-phosphate cytidylyltransferase [Thalassovita aquimarina]|uniref:glycerol-3-phosphate cytidylyltransferase n=1 Tax=Thalassovita aquimarina TaxID=2785917 RepID=UPI003561981F